jgi:hypothetical protein
MDTEKTNQQEGIVRKGPTTATKSVVFLNVLQQYLKV